MIQEAGFSLGESGIAGIHVIGDGLGRDNQIGEFLISSDQVGIGIVVAVAVGIAGLTLLTVQNRIIKGLTSGGKE